MRKKPRTPAHFSMKNRGYDGISFIIPVSQSLYVDRLVNCLASISAQNHGPKSYFEYVLVYIYRKGEEEPSEALTGLMDLARLHDASVVFYGHGLPDYPLALARNVGARRSSRRYLCFVDADLVLDPKTIPVCLEAVPAVGHAAHCLVYRMPEQFAPADPVFRAGQPYNEFVVNRQKGEVDLAGRGGFLYITRELFFYLRGYDEDFVGWGAEDDDMHQRLDNHLQHQRGRTVHLSPEYNVYAMHQWHPHKPDYRKLTPQNRKMLGLKAASAEVVRNGSGYWGGAPV